MKEADKLISNIFFVVQYILLRKFTPNKGVRFSSIVLPQVEALPLVEKTPVSPHRILVENFNIGKHNKGIEYVSTKSSYLLFTLYLAPPRSILTAFMRFNIGSIPKYKSSAVTLLKRKCWVRWSSEASGSRGVLCTFSTNIQEVVLELGRISINLWPIWE